jgi:hypothetical protein
MGKFLEKVLKFLTKFKFFRFESRKFLEFLLGLFGAEKGDIIQEIQDKVNNIVHSIEEFEDIVKEKPNLTAQEVLAEIETMNPDLKVQASEVANFEELLLEIQNVSQLREFVLTQNDIIGGMVDYAKDLTKALIEKGETKFKIAKNMIVSDLEANGQRYTIQTIRFCIEAAVLKNYGK